MITKHEAEEAARIVHGTEDLTPFRNPVFASAFDVWYGELVALGKKHDWPITDPADWREYFEDGYSPMEAMSEDVSYGMDG